MYTPVLLHCNEFACYIALNQAHNVSVAWIDSMYINVTIYNSTISGIDSIQCSYCFSFQSLSSVYVKTSTDRGTLMWTI